MQQIRQQVQPRHLNRHADRERETCEEVSKLGEGEQGELKKVSNANERRCVTKGYGSRCGHYCVY